VRRRAIGISAAVLVVALAAVLPRADAATAQVDFDHVIRMSPTSIVSAAGSHARGPSLVESDGVVTAVWQAVADGHHVVTGSSSFDRGASWTTPQQLSSISSSGEPVIVAAGGVIVTAWLQQNDGQLKITVESSSSSDGGVTWTTPVTLAPDVDGVPPQLVAHEGGFTVAWVSDSIASTSTSVNGVEWGDPIVAAVSEGFYTRLYDLIWRESGLLLFWADYGSEGDDATRINVASSSDLGETWGYSRLVVASPQLHISLQVGSVSEGLMVILGTYPGTRVRASFDGGVTWEDAGPIPLDEEPVLRSDSEGVLAVTTDESSFTWLTVSRDGGRTWSTPQSIGDGQGSGVISDLLVYRGDLVAAGDQFWVTSDSGGVWSRPARLERGEGSGRLPFLIGVGGSVLTAWTSTIGGVERLQVANVLESERIFGADRYATALEVASQFESFDGAPGSFVYIATGADFPDALVAASAAAHRAAPLLLSRPAALDAATLDELRRLDPTRVIIVGGTGALSAQVQSQVAGVVGAANVMRIGGATRYETARRVVQEAFPDLASVYLATGRDFADALAATGAAASQGAAVMITDGAQNRLGPDAHQVVADGDVVHVVVVGGGAVLSAGIEQQLVGLKGADDVTRYAGADRYATSALLNASAGPFGTTAYLATGQSFADALGGAALAGATGAPLFTVPGHCVPQATLNGLRGMRDVRILGGPPVLSDIVLELASCA
jgi:putative cell wall-binding protein